MGEQFSGPPAFQQARDSSERSVSPLGIAALVLGIIACLASWIPFVGLLSIPFAVIGLILGLIGYIVAVSGKKTGTAFPIGGGLVCVISIIIALSSTSGGIAGIANVFAGGQQPDQKVVIYDDPQKVVIQEDQQKVVIYDGRPARSAVSSETELSSEVPSVADVEAAIARSDDFSTHHDVFVSASSDLIRNKICTLDDLRENGGWVKSQAHKDRPVYFTYCSGSSVENRVYVDADTGEVFR